MNLNSQRIYFFKSNIGKNCSLCNTFDRDHMKSFMAKRVISILANFRYLRFRLRKYKKIRKFVIGLLLIITLDNTFKHTELHVGIRKGLFCIIR